MKKMIVTLLQPTGHLHLGNYLGVVRPLLSIQGSLQEKDRFYLGVADQHAWTILPTPKELEKRVFEMLKLLIACGVEDRVQLYRQSSLVEHLQLMWLLQCMCPMNLLNKMTQYKTKAKVHGTLTGLYNYPLLQAADILIHGATHVPVGEDQDQTLELTKELSRRLNGHLGEVSIAPEVIQSPCKRVKNLANPSEKMSKSGSEKGRIDLLDSEEEIRKKVRRAVTDSTTEIYYHVDRPGVNNLLTVYADLVGVEVEGLHFENGLQFKEKLSDVLVDVLVPIQQRYHQLGDEEVWARVREGERVVKEGSAERIQEIYRRAGLSEGKVYGMN